MKLSFSKLQKDVDNANVRFLARNSDIANAISDDAETTPFTDEDQQKALEDYSELLKEKLIKKAEEAWQKLSKEFTEACALPHVKKRRKKLKSLNKRLKSWHKTYLGVDDSLFNLGSEITSEQFAIVFLHWCPFKSSETDLESDDKIFDRNNTIKFIKRQLILSCLQETERLSLQEINELGDRYNIQD